MMPTCLDVHPVYGAIYKDGEFVQRGAVLGLSVDSREVVVAPISGWVRLVSQDPSSSGRIFGLRVEIWQQSDNADSASHASVPN